MVTISTVTSSPFCTNQIEIVCQKIRNIDLWQIGDRLSCDVDKSFRSIYSDAVISSVVHSSKSKVTNLAEITFLGFHEATVHFIPSGISSHFFNLKALHINVCGLLSINKEDLRTFGQSLEFLSLGNNALMAIDADLLEYNPHIKQIWLSGNPITHIDNAFFTNLKNLKNIQVVEFDVANCINQNYKTSSGHNIATFQWNNAGCTDYTAKAKIQDLISSSACLHANQKGKYETTASSSTNFSVEISKIPSENGQSIDNEKLQMEKDRKNLLERLEKIESEMKKLL